MWKHLLKVRYLSAVVAVLAILHAIAFLIMGTETGVRAYGHVLEGAGGEAHQGAGVELLHSLDFLLLALVLIILGCGVAKLFLFPHGEAAPESSSLPSWMNIDSLTSLKVLLWETILTALLILALSILTSEVLETLQWTVLVVPAAILMLALSLFFMKKA